MKHLSNYEAHTSRTFQTGSVQVPTTDKGTFTFPASVQSDLFNYLKPQQQAILRPYLRLIKRPFQEELCISLMDYLEGNGLNPVSQPVLCSLQQQIIEECNLHPLTTRQPKSIGTVIKQLFPSFSSISNR